MSLSWRIWIFRTCAMTLQNALLFRFLVIHEKANSDIDKSWVMSHIRMSRDTQTWVPSHTSESWECSATKVRARDCYVTLSRGTHEWVITPKHQSHHIWVSHETLVPQTSGSETVMGWLWSVGSMKLQVSFAEYRLFCRALLQKRPIIWSILVTKATPSPDQYDQAEIFCTSFESNPIYFNLHTYIHIWHIYILDISTHTNIFEFRI